MKALEEHLITIPLITIIDNYHTNSYWKCPTRHIWWRSNLVNRQTWPKNDWLYFGGKAIKNVLISIWIRIFKAFRPLWLRTKRMSENSEFRMRLLRWRTVPGGVVHIGSTYSIVISTICPHKTRFTDFCIHLEKIYITTTYRCTTSLPNSLIDTL